MDSSVKSITQQWRFDFKAQRNQPRTQSSWNDQRIKVNLVVWGRRCPACFAAGPSASPTVAARRPDAARPAPIADDILPRESSPAGRLDELSETMMIWLAEKHRERLASEGAAFKKKNFSSICILAGARLNLNFLLSSNLLRSCVNSKSFKAASFAAKTEILSESKTTSRNRTCWYICTNEARRKIVNVAFSLTHDIAMAKLFFFGLLLLFLTPLVKHFTEFRCLLFDWQNHRLQVHRTRHGRQLPYKAECERCQLQKFKQFRKIKSQKCQKHTAKTRGRDATKKPFHFAFRPELGLHFNLNSLPSRVCTSIS